MARTFYAANLAMLRRLTDSDFSEYGDTYEPDTRYESCFLGTVFALDPCGRYHHVLSPNGLTRRCAAYWESLDKAAERLGYWIESGEGDPCDVFVCRDASDPEEEGEEEGEAE